MMAPEATSVASNTLEIRLSGSPILALSRLLTTFQSKRMPVSDLSLGRDADGLRATILLDCPPETALRYAALLSGLEDVEEAGPVEESLDVALLKVSGDGWKHSAEQAGIETHEARSDGTFVASGEPEKLEAWLDEIKDDLENLVRFGPVAWPENGGV